MKLLKYYKFVTAIVILTFFGWYLYRYKFRDSDSLIGQVTNRIWNLNSVSIEDKTSPDINVEIFWESDTEKQVVYDLKVYKPGNVHGVNKFRILYNGERKKSFSFIKSNWWNTYDYSFVLTDDNINLSLTPELIVTCW